MNVVRRTANQRSFELVNGYRRFNVVNQLAQSINKKGVKKKAKKK